MRNEEKVFKVYNTKTGKWYTSGIGFVEGCMYNSPALTQAEVNAVCYAYLNVAVFDPTVVYGDWCSCCECCG